MLNINDEFSFVFLYCGIKHFFKDGFHGESCFFFVGWFVKREFEWAAYYGCIDRYRIIHNFIKNISWYFVLAVVGTATHATGIHHFIALYIVIASTCVAPYEVRVRLTRLFFSHAIVTCITRYNIKSLTAYIFVIKRVITVKGFVETVWHVKGFSTKSVAVRSIQR